MGSRRAIRKLAGCAPLVATVVSLVASAPAAANRDRYGNFLAFVDAGFNPVLCNPTAARLDVTTTGIIGFAPVFTRAAASVDHFGTPIAASTSASASPAATRKPSPRVLERTGDAERLGQWFGR